MIGEDVSRRPGALGLGQAAPGGRAGVEQPLPERIEEPGARDLVELRLSHIHQNRVMTRLGQGANRLAASVAGAQSIDLHGVASFFNDLRKLAPSPVGASDKLLSKPACAPPFF